MTTRPTHRPRNYDAMTHLQLEELAAARAIGNGDALTHLQLEEQATANATRFVPGVTDFPRPVAVRARGGQLPEPRPDREDAAALATGIVSASIQGELVKSHDRLRSGPTTGPTVRTLGRRLARDGAE